MNCPFNLNKKIEICINLFQDLEGIDYERHGKRVRYHNQQWYNISSYFLNKIATNQNEKGKNPDFNLTCWRQSSCARGCQRKEFTIQPNEGSSSNGLRQCNQERTVDVTQSLNWQLHLSFRGRSCASQISPDEVSSSCCSQVTSSV